MPASQSGTPYDYEVIVIGAGVCGIYQIKRLVDLGISATVLEGEAAPGGTWHNNRYPGARFDSESYSYIYSFSSELLQEWDWTEEFSAQPDNLRYLNYVVDKFDLARHMQFNCRVASARFDEERDLWSLTVSDGRTLTCRFVVLSLGLLSIPTLPRFPGMDAFKGPSFHTFHWPHEPVDLGDKRVAIIGTGATAIQIIGEIADKVGALTVYQRRPNWCAPLNNSKISSARMEKIRERYDEIFRACEESPGGFVHVPDRRGFWEVSRQERVALWDKLYDEPGFGIWLANFREIFTDEKANAEFSEYMAARMRARVNDPNVAEKLIPKDHGFGVQRVPLETNYLEAYNYDHVDLVDTSEDPIQRITEQGIQTGAGEREFDLIVYATGFNAITGAFESIDIRGTDGQSLRDKWRDGPSTFLGLTVSGFPNMLMPTGPQSGSGSFNFPRGIEVGVNWCTRLIEHARRENSSRFEATTSAEQRWVKHVVDLYSMMLIRKAKGWFTGYNSNLDGHEAGTVRYMIYPGGLPKFRSILDEEAEAGYPGIELEQRS